MDWTLHKKHRNLVAEDFGQWVGLADEHGVPMMNLPAPMNLNAPQTRLSPVGCSATFLVRSPSGTVHPLLEAVGLKDIGRTTVEGTLVPISGPARFLAVERTGIKRRTFRLTHMKIESKLHTMPQTITLYGVDMLKQLSGIVAMTNPSSWEGEFKTFERDWVGPENSNLTFKKPRDLLGMTMTSATDGATIGGQAVQAIRRVITTSIEAQMTAIGRADWEGDYPIQVADTESTAPSEWVLITLQDESLWETIAPVALAAGVKIGAYMWWPGDEMPKGLDLKQPTIVVTVEPGEVE